MSTTPEQEYAVEAVAALAASQAEVRALREALGAAERALDMTVQALHRALAPEPPEGA